MAMAMAVCRLTHGRMGGPFFRTRPQPTTRREHERRVAPERGCERLSPTNRHSDRDPCLSPHPVGTLSRRSAPPQTKPSPLFPPSRPMAPHDLTGCGLPSGQGLSEGRGPPGDGPAQQPGGSRSPVPPPPLVYLLPLPPSSSSPDLHALLWAVKSTRSAFPASSFIFAAPPPSLLCWVVQRAPGRGTKSEFDVWRFTDVRPAPGPLLSPAFCSIVALESERRVWMAYPWASSGPLWSQYPLSTL